MHAYLSWEIDLVNEIARDGTVRFGTERRQARRASPRRLTCCSV